MCSAQGDHSHLDVIKTSPSYNNEHPNFRLFEAVYLKLMEEPPPELKRSCNLVSVCKAYLIDSTTKLKTFWTCEYTFTLILK